MRLFSIDIFRPFLYYAERLGYIWLIITLLAIKAEPRLLPWSIYSILLISTGYVLAIFQERNLDMVIIKNVKEKNKDL